MINPFSAFSLANLVPSVSLSTPSRAGIDGVVVRPWKRGGLVRSFAVIGPGTFPNEPACFAFFNLLAGYFFFSTHYVIFFSTWLTADFFFISLFVTFFSGGTSSFEIGCRSRSEYGYSYVPGVLTFELADGKEFHILRFLAVQVVSDLFDDLKPTSKYQPPRKVEKVPWDVKTTPGLQLPP